MFSRLCILSVLLTLLASALPAFSAENAPKQATADPRLDVKVTLLLGPVTLDQLAAELIRQTGVKIKAGSGKSDWQVKERKTIIFAEDITLGQVLNRVVTLHHYRLAKSGEAPSWSYMIWQDRRACDEEAKIQEDAKDAGLKAAKRAIDYMRQLTANAGNISQAELDRLAEKDPYKHFLLTDPTGKAMCEFASLLSDSIFSNKSQIVGMPLDDNSNPQLSMAASRCLIEMDKLEMLTDAGGSSSRRYQELQSKLQQPVRPVFIRFNGFRDEGINTQYEMGIISSVDINAGDRGSQHVPIIDPKGKFASLIGKLVRKARSGMDHKELQAEFAAAEKAMLDDIPLKGDPLLEEKIKLDKAADYAATWKAVHEKIKLPVIADSYRESIFMEPGEHTIKTIVNRAGGGFNKETSKDSGWLVVADKKWAEKRTTDIPQAYINYLAKTHEERDMGTEDFKRLVMDLSDEQITRNLLIDPRFADLSFLYSKDVREGLRFVASLSARDLEAMTGSNKLPAANLPDPVVRHGLAVFGMEPADMDTSQISFSGYSLMTDAKGTEIGLGFSLIIPKPDGGFDTVPTTFRAWAPKKGGESKQSAVNSER